MNREQLRFAQLRDAIWNYATTVGLVLDQVTVERIAEQTIDRAQQEASHA